MVSTLAMTDALTKLLIAKGIITDKEFKAQLGTERANYLAMLKRCTEMRRRRSKSPSRRKLSGIEGVDFVC